MSKIDEVGPGAGDDAPGGVDLSADIAATRAAEETIAAEPYDGSKPAAEIEADIAHTRANIGETLDALERRLAPRHLMERGIDMVRDTMKGHADNFGTTVTDALRGNPVPVALIGVGLGWLLLSNTSYGQTGQRKVARYSRSVGRSVSGVLGSAAESVSDTAGRWAGQARDMVTGGGGGDTYAYARQKTERGASGTSSPGADIGNTAGRAGDAGRTAYRAAGDYASRAGEKASDTAGSAAEYGRAALERAGDYAGQAGRQASALRSRASHVMEDYPLAVGALGFIAGALVAASLPSTEIENEWVGDTSDQLWDQAQEVGRDTLGRVQQVASTAAGAAVDAASDAARQATDTALKEAERQGLMPGGDKESGEQKNEGGQGASAATSGNKPGGTASVGIATGSGGTGSSATGGGIGKTDKT